MTTTSSPNIFPYVESRKHTRYETIKSMSFDEMARMICSQEVSTKRCENCVFFLNPKGCEETMKRSIAWLKEEI